MVAVPRLLLCAALAVACCAAPAARAGVREDRKAALDLLGRGTAAFRVGDVAAATRHWTEAIRLCRVAGAPALEAEALARRGEHARARERAERALEIARATGHAGVERHCRELLAGAAAARPA